MNDILIYPDPKAGFETDLRLALGGKDPAPAFVDRLYQTLQRRAAAAEQAPQRPLRRRPVPRWAWIAASLVVIALLFTFRQPVLASIGHLFGYAYVPEAGFVAVDQVRVLEHAVRQEHDGQSLTAAQGLAMADSTRIWLTFSDAARPVDGTWLEAPDGTRFELLSWQYSPDEVGSTGVLAYFPPLPAETDQVTLILPEGWHLPLTWVPGTMGNLMPADVTLTTMPAGGTGTPAETAGGPCIEAYGVPLCVKAAAWEGDDLQVLLETEVNTASNYDFSLFQVPDAMQGWVVSDDSGTTFPIATEYFRTQTEGDRLIATLTFPGARGLAGPLQLTLPSVLVSLPIQDTFEVDLGDDPQPGQVIPLDQTVVVDDLTVHFSQAELVGSDETTLTLSIESDPLDNTAAVQIYSLGPGRPEGVEDRYGFGTSLERFSIHVQLYQNGKVLTGTLRIPLISATLKVNGPFMLGFEAPPETNTIESPPEVASDAPYSPLPVGEPLPMEDFQYTGETLQAGDLLSVEVGERRSRLYAAAPEDGFTQRLVAVLPGEVTTVQAHPDLLGLDYLVGSVDGNGNLQYDQLYTLRFGEGDPVMLIGQFGPRAHGFTWSYDGLFLIYHITEEAPGEMPKGQLRLVDMVCRETAASEPAACEPVTLLTSGGFGQLTWSPAAYQIAFVGGGDAQVQDSDISVLTLDPETLTTTVENLTQSPTIQDFGTVVWMPAGDQLYYPCWTGETSSNEYSLCAVSLAAPGDQVVEPLLPWNMHRIQLSEGRWVLDKVPVMRDGEFSVRTYDLQSGQSDVLLAWPAERKYFINIYSSPSSPWVAITRYDQPGLRLVNIADRSEWTLSPLQEDRLLFVGWVP